MSSRPRLTVLLASVLAVLGSQAVGIPAGNAISLITPYAHEADMASINDAFSVDACAPWGFAHDGIDFFPAGTLAAFQAVSFGTVERIGKFLNQGNGYWQVNVDVRHDATYSFGYAFEPMSALEVDGDIQLANIAVTEGQLVSAGDVIGWLHAVGAGAHVHFGFSANDTPVCPASYFTPPAADSIVTVLQWTWPHARMCYGLEHPVPTASIVLDGDPADWGGILPIAGDWQHDGAPLCSGDDIRALYLAKDASTLYLRLDLWEDANPAFGNGPAPEEGRYSFHLGTDGPYPTLYLSVAYDQDNAQWRLGHNGSNAPGMPPVLEERPDLVGVSGSVIEVGVPLASIGSPTAFDDVRAEVVNCCGPSFAVLDETHCVNKLVLTSPADDIQALARHIAQALGLPKGAERSLLASLESAVRSLEMDLAHAAVNKLRAFIHHVEAQRGKQLSPEEADRLIAEARRIVARLG